jgi:hypothetical protein
VPFFSICTCSPPPTRPAWRIRRCCPSAVHLQHDLGKLLVSRGFVGRELI